MNNSHPALLLAFLLAVPLLGACHSPDTGESETADDPYLDPLAVSKRISEPPTGTNGLTPACFWSSASQQALRALGGTALDAGSATLPSGPSGLVDAPCRDVLRYAIQCALPEGDSLQDPVNGDTYEGWWGLAPSWRTGALGTAGRRYVTACILERLNATGAEVPILLEGPSPAIARRDDLLPDYPVVESTAWGDLFSSTTPLNSGLPPFRAYLCWEGLLPQLSVLSLLSDRVCDDLPVCGLMPIGPCALSCVPNGPYWACRTALLSPTWQETVRVKLEDAN